MKAVYAGSFDPFTYGHLSVVLNGLRVFEEVHILVAQNADKKGLFTVQERVSLITQVVQGIEHVTVGSTSGYVVVYARQHGYPCLVRGLRGETDARAELALAEINGAMAPDIQTVFIPTSPSLAEHSSTRVKELHAQGQSVSLYAPPEVIRALDVKKRSGSGAP